MVPLEISSLDISIVYIHEPSNDSNHSLSIISGRLLGLMLYLFILIDVLLYGIKSEFDDLLS